MSGIAPTGERPVVGRDRPLMQWNTTLLAARKTFTAFAVWSLPALLLLLLIVVAFAPVWASDFRAFYDAAGAYVHHRSPYPQASLSAVAGRQGFVYPAPVAVLFVPFWVLPFPLAATLYILLCAAAIVGTLWILGVRDWRCYGAALLVWPLQWGVLLGTLSPILAFLLALLWRYRDRRAVAAPLLAALVVSKIFLWPLALWFVAMHRFRTVVYATVGGAAAVLLTTLPLGLGTLNDYRDVLHQLSRYESTFSLSPFTFFKTLGLGAAPALVAVAALAVPLVIGLVRAARAHDELLALRVTVALAFVCSPIVWGHYFTLLLVPLALLRPRFSAVWFALAVVPGDLNLWAADERANRALCIAVVWVFALWQLGFVPKKLSSVRIPAPVLGIAGTALLCTVLVLNARYELFTTSLDSASAAGPNGAALVQVSRGGSSVCWDVWTQGVSGKVSAAVVGPAGARYPVPVRLDGDGNAKGCAPLPSHAAASSIRRHPKRYRLELRPRDGGPVIGGMLHYGVYAGRPADSTGQ